MINKLLKYFTGKRVDRVNIEEVKQQLTDTIKPIESPKPKKIIKYEKDGYYFKIGTRVICRSNECEPLLIGKIVEFWDNDGKWSDPISHVKDEVTGKVWGVCGIIRPYSSDLYNEIKDLKPLEQWNHFVDEPYRYSE